MSHDYLTEETKKLPSNGYLAEIRLNRSPSLDGHWNCWTMPNIFSACSFVGRVMVVSEPLIPELDFSGCKNRERKFFPCPHQLRGPQAPLRLLTHRP